MTKLMGQPEVDARREALRARLADIQIREAELEAEIGITPLEFAHEQRRLARKRLAPYEAVFGQGGNWEERRKSFRAKIATEIAEALEIDIAQAHAAVEKRTDLDAKAKAAAHKEIRGTPSEAELERIAAGSPQYIRFIKAGARMKRKYLEMKDIAREWEERIQRGQAIARYVSFTPSAHSEEDDK